jgi:hypothetical protein
MHSIIDRRITNVTERKQQNINRRVPWLLFGSIDCEYTLPE